MSIKSKLSRWIDRALRMPTCEEIEALAYDFLETGCRPRSWIPLSKST